MTGVKPERYYEDAVYNSFPAPDIREKQKPTIKAALKAFHNGKDVVQVDAPPGLGKSLILYSIAKAMGGEVFYVTPLNSLVDQLDNDQFISNRVKTIKGRRHYECISDFAPPGVNVDKAPCQKQSNFDCDIKDECLYYGRKKDAKTHPFVVTNMSYIMADSMMPDDADQFGDRDILIVDECQNIDDFALDFISFTVSKNILPKDVWSRISIPHKRFEEQEDKLVEWVEDEVSKAVKKGIRHRQSKEVKTDKDIDELDGLVQFHKRTEKFLQDCINNDWIAQIDWAGRGSDNNKIKFQPITVGRFLHELLWDRADNIILSSATIPKGGWLNDVGLGSASVQLLNVGSLFPIKNRPIITDHAVGKMTYEEKEDNMEDMAKKIKEIADYHTGEKGIVHCRSYKLADRLQRTFYDNGDVSWFDKNVIKQRRDKREESLNKWKAGSKQLFFSVNMTEGISLDNDACRFQILAKVLYPYMNDKRTKYRIQERNDWDWYNNQAAIQIEQAYGRAVRGEKDYATFYILDESAIGLIKRNKHLFHDWFLEAMVNNESSGIMSYDDYTPNILNTESSTW